ncbi:snapalysin family zinc-dependent metalloprotease [Streptomyces sp. Li-HN-5-11]|uniref:snapalysin family zinc-dependent metalloprotease n=1 Tax=Streptomyces sp. Li-HN-5-11 TaxID=3075432 RepID=UPI0028AB4644|nr:snapalysin family zinc-dependent metalloprotease [Streptomyces sp. Li-HN-5-11]WNM33701.1 snapalysin family zinc-dependent metalloprotease [Streptomyces sp. Li-HN-5-11]
MIKRVAALAACFPAMLSTTVGVASAHSAPHATPAVVTLTYDASDAGQWAGPIKRAVQNWNAAVHNVRLEPASTPGSADYVYEATSGWPQTTLGPIFPGGNGDVQLGRQAVDEGYDATRIAAHETGHILGLPDHYSGPCSELMSGHGPGTACTNAKPDAAEAARVDRNYADGTPAVRPHHHQVVIDIWSGRVLTGSR